MTPKQKDLALKAIDSLNKFAQSMKNSSDYYKINRIVEEFKEFIADTTYQEDGFAVTVNTRWRRE